MKATEQFFPVVLLNNLYPVQFKVVFIFESANQVKRVLSCSAAA